MLGELIRTYRQRKQYDLNAFAEMINISKSYLGDIERNTKTPSLDVFKAIARALEIPADYLLRDEHDFAVYTLNDVTNRLRNEKTERLNNMINILELIAEPQGEGPKDE